MGNCANKENNQNPYGKRYRTNKNNDKVKKNIIEKENKDSEQYKIKRSSSEVNRAKSNKLSKSNRDYLYTPTDSKDKRRRASSKRKHNLKKEHKERVISTLNEYDRINLSECFDPYTKETCLHFCASNGHADLLEIIMEKDPLIVNSVDDDKNTPFHTLCKNTVSSKQDLIYMYNMLKKYGCDRRAKNIHDETGLKIIEERIKFSNPYDSSLTAVQGFMEYIEPTKHKSLITISSCPKSKLKRFSGISIIDNHNK